MCGGKKLNCVSNSTSKEHSIGIILNFGFSIWVSKRTENAQAEHIFECRLLSAGLL